MLADTFERPLRDLRISVTDRCSFRCVYCMPRDEYDGHEYLDRSVVKPGVYVYYVQDVDVHGRTTLHGPVIVDRTGRRADRQR